MAVIISLALSNFALFTRKTTADPGRMRKTIIIVQKWWSRYGKARIAPPPLDVSNASWIVIIMAKNS